MDTMGGGVIVGTHTQKHKRFRREVIKRLEVIEKDAVEDVIVAILEMKQPLEMSQLLVQWNLSVDEAQKAINVLIKEKKIMVIGSGGGAILFTESGWERLIKKAEAVIEGYHRRFATRQGMPKGELSSKLGLSPHSPVLHKLFDAGVLIEDGVAVRLPSHKIQLNQEQQAKVDKFLQGLNQNPYSPPSEVMLESDLLNLLVEQQKVVKVGDGVVFSRIAYDEMVSKILTHAKKQGSITLAGVRDMFGTSRKYAKALLEYMDEKKLTRRVGDERVVR
jgi:selenocysteine-specific elongation factor